MCQFEVHDAAAEVLHRGLWKPNGDEDACGPQNAAFSCACLTDVGASGDADAEDSEEALHDDAAGQVSNSYVFVFASIGLLSYDGSLAEAFLVQGLLRRA